MKNVSINIEKRARLESKDLNLSTFESNQIHLVNNDGETIIKFDCEYKGDDMISSYNYEGAVDFKSSKRLFDKYMNCVLSVQKFDFYLKRLQKYTKNTISATGETSETTKKETVSVTVEPSREQFKMKSTPKVGLEAQIYDITVDAINDKSTTNYIKETTQKYLDDNGIKPNVTEIVIKNVDYEMNVGTQHFQFETIMQVISARVPLALVGPAGSGKTRVVENVASALNLNFYSKSVTAQTGVHEFFGYMNANGEYVSTLFREAYEEGGVFLLDEFDAGNPNVLAALNQATANGSAAFADKMVEKHEDFLIVMAGNTYGHGATTEYVGRNKIDAATLDRFAFVTFEYDENLEMQISPNTEWTKKVQRIRAEVAKKKIKTIISPRASINGGKLLATGMSEKMVIELTITKGLNKDEIALLSNVL